MAATDLVTEAQVDSLATTAATAVKANATAITADGVSISALQAAVGTVGDLDTTASDLVEAVNEVRVTAEAAAGGGVAINDGNTATGSTWSSSKIDTEIGTQSAAAASAAVDVVIGAASGAADTLAELEATDTSLLSALGSRLRFDAAQTLAAGQRTQALTNLGVARSVQDFAADFTAALA